MKSGAVSIALTSVVPVVDRILRGFLPDKRPVLVLLTGLVLALSLSGCCSRINYSTNCEPVAEMRIRKVAVLPFSNISGKRGAAAVIESAYVTALFKSASFIVEEPGNVRRFLIGEQVKTTGEMEVERLLILGKRLRVDAVIIGTVEEFDDGRARTPTVSISARMVESGTGRLLWTSQHKRRGDDYIIIFEIGKVRNTTKLAHKVVGEMVETIK